MRGTKFLMGILCIIAWNTNAQQDNNWYFGRMAGLNFSNGRPVAITNSKMTTMEGSAAISSQNGDLRFYTNGIYVWNKNNQLMPHGSDLLGDQSTTQSAIIIQKPGQKDHYYIFAADDAGGPNGLTFSEVDMTADGGKGDVISKNNRLITPVTEKIAAVQHFNGIDVWVTTHHWGSNAFYSYKVTAGGVTTTPVISYAGMVVDGAENSGHYAGWMSFSPNGTHIAMANGLFAAELFDFDAATGIVSDAVTVKSPAACYGVEFSPNSKLLYLSSDNKIYQYQVNATNVAQSQIEVGKIDVASSMKLGPDSKIYVVHKYLAKSLSVINNPDVIGKGCNLVYEAVDLGGKETFVGLPNFMTTPFYVLDIKTASDCSDTAVSFTATTTMDSDTVLWDFGDGNTSTSLNVTHTYAKTGTYLVKAKAKRGTSTRYYTKTITILKAPIAIQPDDMITCGNEESAAVFNLHDQDAAILGEQPADNYLVSYHISLPDAETGNNPLPNNYSVNTGSQTLYARVYRDTGICYAVTSFKLTVAPKPIIDMKDSYGYCQGSSIILLAPAGMDSYLWSTGETTASIRIDKAGTYTLTVTKKTGATVCETTKSITVHESYQPVIKDIEVNEWTSNNNSITIITEGEGDYEYSIDGANYQDSNVFNQLTPGQYKVIVREKNGCGFTEDKVVLLMYPKYFTPNGDGFHDTWQVDNAYYDPKMIIYIFDRYGKLLTSFKGSTPGWDGTFNGNKLPATDYWFIVHRSDGKEYKGHFAMMR